MGWLLPVVLGLILVVKTVQVVERQAYAPPDFMGFYFGAKLLGQVDIYNRPAFVAAVSADAELAQAPPLDPAVRAIAPAPQPLYPPSAFWMMKPYAWLGINRAIALHAWLSLAAGLAAAFFTGLIAGRLGGPWWRLVGTSGVLTLYVIAPVYAHNISFGQVNLWVAAGLTGAVALAPRRAGLAASLLLVTMLLKPSGLLVAVPLLWQARGRFRQLWPALVVGLILAIGPGFAAWQEWVASVTHGSVKAWTLSQANAPGSTNAAVEAVARQAGGGAGQQTLLRLGLIGLYLGLFGLILFALRRRQTSVAGAASAAVAVGFLLGPISWNIHGVFLLPFWGLGLLAAWQDARRGAASGAWVWVVAAMVLALLGSGITGPANGALARVNVLLSLPLHILCASLLALQSAAALRAQPLPVALPRPHSHD